MNRKKLQEATDLLASAKTQKDLINAHTALSAAIRQQRRQKHTALGPLAQTLKDGMVLWDQHKAQGGPEAERVDLLKHGLQAVWPQTRAWAYECSACDDTGWQHKVCTDGDRCDGQSTFSAGPHLALTRRRLCTTHQTLTHTYVVPCFCRRGQQMKTSVGSTVTVGRKRAALDESGKSKPTRIGR